MRVVEALAAGVIVAVVVVLLANRLDVPADRVVVAAVGFLVPFLAVLLRSDRPYNVVKRR
jgi:hypothetical protein